jgi:hypothetical protein
MKNNMKAKNKINYDKLFKSSRDLVNNKNFRNNQNYILWNIEKKKLLSKFFVENFKSKIYLFLNKIDFTISKVNSENSFSIYIIFIWIFVYILYFPILYTIIWLIIFIISFTIKLNSLQLPINYKNKIVKFRDYLIDKRKSSISMNIFLLLIWLSIISAMPVYLIYYFNTYFLIDIDILVLLFLCIFAPIAIFYFYKFYKYLNKTILVKFKLLNILLSPFFLFFIIIYWFYSLLRIFIFNSDKKYMFLKTNPFAHLLSEFTIINSVYAKNKNYIIAKK